MDFATAVDRELAGIRAMLIDKNRAYGNSALEPAATVATGTVGVDCK